MKHGTLITTATILLLPLLIGCGGGELFVAPPEWTSAAARDSVVATFAPWCAGKTIFLDPGHGGESDAAVSPNKRLREGDINLRIALRLRDYLRQAGAVVLLSRDSDVAVPLEARAHQANVNKADLFVSIHQNASSDPTIQYTSVVYHSRPGRRGYQPSSQDLARYLQRELAWVMRTPDSRMSFDGTVSDFVLAPDRGLAVLREARMTAVLVECGFLSHPVEEERLARPEYTDLQAWGLFNGIARYLKAGIPTLTYIGPLWFRDSRPKVELLASDSLGIQDESIKVDIDGVEQGFSFNARTGRITILPSEELSQGYHVLSAQVRNSQDNSSAPFSTWFAVGSRPASLKQSTDPAELPPDPRASALITITAHDSSGALLGDGLPIRFTTSAGWDTLLITRKGVATATLSATTPGRLSFEASNGPVTTQGSVTVSANARYTRGLVMGVDGKPLAGATITLPGRSVFPVNAAGEYIVSGVQPDGLEVTVSAPGYFTRQEALTREIVQDPFVLGPVASGVLIGKPVLLVPTPAQKGIALDTALEARALRSLSDLLKASGAQVFVLPPPEGKKGPRAALLAAHPEALAVQMQFPRKGVRTLLRTAPAWGHPEAALAAWTLYTGGTAQKQTLSGGLLAEAPRLKLLSGIVPASGSMEVQAMQTAWGLYAALLAREGAKSAGTRTISVQVTDRATGGPAVHALVELNGTLRAMTNAKGLCVFRQVSTSDDEVRVLEPEKYDIRNVNTEVAR